MENIIQLKHQIMQSSRKRLLEQSFLEVNTPIVIEPFCSPGNYHIYVDVPNKDRQEAFLRSCTENALKSLLKCSDRIFEIGPAFRMDSIDRSHMREFMMLDSFSKDTNTDLLCSIFLKILKDVFPSSEEPITVSIEKLLKENIGIDIEDVTDNALRNAIIDSKPRDFQFLEIDSTRKIVKNYIGEVLSSKKGIIFAKDYPAFTIPTAKKQEERPWLADWFIFSVQGVEIGMCGVHDNLASNIPGTSPTPLTLTPMERYFDELVQKGELPRYVCELAIGLDRICSLIENVPIQKVVLADEISFNVRSIK